MQKEYQPLSLKKYYNKAKPCENSDKSSFRANPNVRAWRCLAQKNQYSYDDYGFRVRKLAKSSPEVVAKDRKAKFTEIIYPSMYYGLERQLNRNRAIIDNTHASVNNIYLNGVRIASVSDK